jgi:membrane-bound lytic murein transglycosylase A
LGAVAALLLRTQLSAVPLLVARPAAWTLPRTVLGPLLLSAALLAAVGCSTTEPAASDAEATMELRRAPFGALPGWEGSAPAPALEAFQRSCSELLQRPLDRPMLADRPAFGAVRDWRPACRRAQALGDTSHAAARQFFTRFFRPYRVALGARTSGLFTGYYEPQLQGARDSSARFSEPLHRRPPDLVRVPVERFLPAVKGETIFGRVKDGVLVPYPTRAEIANGALAGTGAVLAWVDSRIDKFFLQIQGSGRVVLADSSVLRVGYAAQNGRPYRAIGRDLIAMGAVPREQMSMQAIRAWLRTHPQQADSLMNQNPSYVFFRTLDIDPALGPLGAQGVPLTPERSLAVDPRSVPFGTPLWVDTRRPATADEAPGPVADTATVPFRQLMVAQDTGGAIRGAIRGDVFWGAGARARSIAGRMQSPGTVTVLLPRTLVPLRAPATTE